MNAISIQDRRCDDREDRRGFGDTPNAMALPLRLFSSSSQTDYQIGGISWHITPAIVTARIVCNPARIAHEFNGFAYKMVCLDLDYRKMLSPSLMYPDLILMPDIDTLPARFRTAN